MQKKKTACILCSRNCGLEIETENGRLVKISGDHNHPLSRGYRCQKSLRLDYYQNHKDRLRHPLRRRADGSFVRVAWEEVLADITEQLNQLKKSYGGSSFATAGGGGQGNHLGGGYLAQIRAAMGSYNSYNALGQEKTGDFWLNGRLFGSQACHTTEDIENSDYVIFLGCNPYQSHGIVNARKTLLEISKDAQRTMVVIDPRRTETAKLADIHLQVRPGTDAYLLSAILSTIIREDLHDKDFLSAHCSGFESIKKVLLQTPVEAYASRTGVPLTQIQAVARGFARVKCGCVRADLGIQHSLHSTLNSYLEKLLYLVTGNFGVQGGNNLHSSLIPVLGNTDERNPHIKRTAHHKMFPIAGVLPPNILPDEIVLGGESKIRSVIVDSCNPVRTWPDSKAYENAFRSLDLLIVVDTAMTETAQLAHYVLPAASQFEKWECTGFNLEFPRNVFHLRQPLLQPLEESLPEAEIYTRILEKMGVIPKSFPLLSRLAPKQPTVTRNLIYLAALALTIIVRKKLAKFAASILYRTLGPTLAGDAAPASILLPLAVSFAAQHTDAVRRSGFHGNRFTMGTRLFRTILKESSGLVVSTHKYDEVWSLLKTKDKKIHLEISEMLDSWRELAKEEMPQSQFPILFSLGERRPYNANNIFRNPEWRMADHKGAAKIHPDDACQMGLADGTRVVCETEYGETETCLEYDENSCRGFVSLPHGYGMTYGGEKTPGPIVNHLTSTGWCDSIAKTPFHKYVPGNIRPA